MSFATLPLIIVLGLLATVLIIVVLLYLLKRTPKPQIVSNVEFWLEAVQRAKPRFLTSTRIPLLSLLFTLLVALLLASEIGGPRFGEGVRGTTVIVLSADRTMGAEEGGRSRLDRAIDETRRWVGRGTGAGEVAVVRAGIRPSILMPLTDDAADLDRALEDLVADDGPADLDAAVAVADELVQRRGGTGQILLIADRASEARPRSPIALVPVGGTADSIGITSLVARRDPVAVGEYSVHVEVASFTSRSARARLIVQDRDVIVFDQPFTLGAQERQTFSAQGFSSAQGEVIAVLDEIEIAGSEDHLASDDAAYAVAAPLPRTKVLVITPGEPFLEGVLGAHGGIDVTIRDSVAGISADTLAEHQVVVFDRIAPPEGLSHPGVLAIGVPGSVSGIAHGRALSGPRITASMAGHDALRGVRLDSVRIGEAWALDVEPTDHVLVRAGEDALVVARENGGRRTVALGFELSQTDLVERVAFPLFVHHTVRWLAGFHTDAPLASVPGTPVVVPGDTPVLDPEGEPLEPVAGIVTDTGRAGIYHVGERAIAISGASVAAQIPAPAPLPAADTVGRLPALTVLIAAALLLLLVLEWILLHRGRLA
jgi:hypothetical protein